MLGSPQGGSEMQGTTGWGAGRVEVATLAREHRESRASSGTIVSDLDNSADAF